MAAERPSTLDLLRQAQDNLARLQQAIEATNLEVLRTRDDISVTKGVLQYFKADGKTGEEN